MSEFRPHEGSFDVEGAHFAIVVSRWNQQVTDGLLEGAVRALGRHNIGQQSIDIHCVPGAFELPMAAKRVAQVTKVDAIITLGCVIRGDTPHFDYVCSECTRGVGEVALSENLPVAFGVLTTDNLDQALIRSGNNAENKGEEAALTALEMVTLYRRL